MTHRPEIEELERIISIQQKEISGLKTLLDGLPDLICISRTDGTVELLNPAWESTLGYTLDEIRATRLFDLIHPDDRSSTMQEVEKQLAGEETRNFLNRYLCKDGSYKTLEWRAAPAKSGLLFATARDVTVRREVEARQSATLLQMEAHSDNSPLAVIEFDPAFRVVRWPRSAEQLFGWTAGEIVGRAISEMRWVHEEDTELVAQESAGLFDGGRARSVCSNRNYRKDGSVVHCEWYNSAIYDSEGQMISVLSLVLDVTARKQAEQALIESEQRYRGLFEHMLNGFAYCRMIFDEGEPSDFIYLDVNKAFTDLTGLKDVVGKRVSDVIPGIRESDPELLQIYGRVSLSGVPEVFELYLESLAMWFSISVYSPQKEHFVALFDVITERKIGEEALRKSEEKLKLAQQSSRAGVWDWDMPEGRLDWSPEMFTLFGLDPAKDEESLDIWDRVLHPDDKEETHRRLNAAIENGTLLDIEYRVVHPDGAMRWIKALGNTTVDPDGKPTRMAGMCIDITSQKEAAEALRESEAQFRTLFDKAADAIFILDFDGRILEVNQVAVDRLGYSHEEFMQTRVTEFHDWADEQEMLERLRDIEEGGYSIFEGAQISKDGRILPVESVFQVVDFRGRKAILHSERDISDRKQAETQRRNLETQLLQAQRLQSVGTLAGGIAHDFNNILASVIGYSELALDEVLPRTPLHEHLKEVLKAGQRARDLVRQILIFGGKGEPDKKPVRLNSLIRETIRMAKAVIPTSVEIQPDLCPEELTLCANPSQVDQVIVNLLTNAAHAVEGNGLVQVTLRQVTFDEARAAESPGIAPGDYAEICVSDNGHGIAPEHLGLIFDPYFTTKSPDKGTGLGLAVVHGIVKIHGGQISVRSELGTGTSFCIHLPLHQELPSDSSRPSDSLGAGVGEGAILLVDDEPAICKMQKHILERRGYSVVALSDSREAVEAFRADPDGFDLFITDMTMPNLTGDRLIEAIKKIRADIPVILCTGYSEKLDSSSEVSQLIDGFLMKPFSADQMAAMTERLIRKAKKTN